MLDIEGVTGCAVERQEYKSTSIERGVNSDIIIFTPKLPGDFEQQSLMITGLDSLVYDLYRSALQGKGVCLQSTGT